MRLGQRGFSPLWCDPLFCGLTSLDPTKQFIDAPRHAQNATYGTEGTEHLQEAGGVLGRSPHRQQTPCGGCIPRAMHEEWHCTLATRPVSQLAAQRRAVARTHAAGTSVSGRPSRTGSTLPKIARFGGLWRTRSCKTRHRFRGGAPVLARASEISPFPTPDSLPPRLTPLPPLAAMRAWLCWRRLTALRIPATLPHHTLSTLSLEAPSRQWRGGAARGHYPGASRTGDHVITQTEKHGAADLRRGAPETWARSRPRSAWSWARTCATIATCSGAERVTAVPSRLGRAPSDLLVTTRVLAQ